MDEKFEQFLSELNDEIKRNYKRYQHLKIIQWCIMIPVVIAGALTTAAGITGNYQIFWFATPYALMAWGLVTAVGSAANQTGNPKQRSEHFYKVKIALKGIRGAIQYQGLPIEEANRLRTLARKDPEAAVEELTGRQLS